MPNGDIGGDWLVRIIIILVGIFNSTHILYYHPLAQPNEYPNNPHKPYLLIPALLFPLIIFLLHIHLSQLLWPAFK